MLGLIITKERLLFSPASGDYLPKDDLAHVVDEAVDELVLISYYQKISKANCDTVSKLLYYVLNYFFLKIPRMPPFLSLPSGLFGISVFSSVVVVS